MSNYENEFVLQQVYYRLTGFALLLKEAKVTKQNKSCAIKWNIEQKQNHWWLTTLDENFMAP